jgi:hypothetical protein
MILHFNQRHSWVTDDRSILFTGIFRELENQKSDTDHCEDIHWADEAPDFEVFIRRITRLHCLYSLLTVTMKFIQVIR